MALEQKFLRLQKIISDYSSCLVAFSGGTDSAFLLKAASLVLPKDKLLAVTAVSATYPKEELASAKKMASSLGVRHKIIKTDELKDKNFISNRFNRCYFCKRGFFLRLKRLAAKENLEFVLDASNSSDKTDFRPGNLAKKELKVRSPLQRTGFSKQEIRKLSKKLGLKTWDKPSSACLASRIPYGTKINPDILGRVDKGESYLRKLGFTQVRLRHYGDFCRIEVLKNEVPALISKRKQAVDKLKKLGYNYVTIDLEGYRTGSLNEVIKR